MLWNLQLTTKPIAKIHSDAGKEFEISLYDFICEKGINSATSIEICLFFYYFHIVIAFYFEFNEILCARVNSAIKFIYAALRVKWKHILLASREFGRAVPDLQIEFTPALATFSDAESDASSAWGSVPKKKQKKKWNKTQKIKIEIEM